MPNRTAYTSIRLQTFTIVEAICNRFFLLHSPQMSDSRVVDPYYSYSARLLEGCLLAPSMTPSLLILFNPPSRGMGGPTSNCSCRSLALARDEVTVRSTGSLKPKIMFPCSRPLLLTGLTIPTFIACSSSRVLKLVLVWKFELLEVNFLKRLLI